MPPLHERMADVVRLPEGTERLWQTLARSATAGPPAFDPESLDGLPAPARRWLGRVVPAGVPLVDAVVLHMSGEIRIGPRWLPFTARQIIRATVGFVWQPTVGGRIARFVGADLLGPDEARMEFRLHGIIPIVRASGPDIAMSAAGRLAAETVAWLPQAVTPQMGARWAPVDDTHAVVALGASGQTVEITVGIDRDGRLHSVELERWNGSVDPPGARPFGGDMTAELLAPEGVRIAGSGTVGWDYRTPAWADGAFFRFRIDRVEPLGADAV